MLQSIKKILVVALSLQLACFNVWAQDNAEGVSSTSGPRKQLATIVFAGLAGATLGLSTLSFYGRPQEKFNNIAIGLALGIIVGAGYTTYKISTQPYGYEEVRGFDEERALSLDVRTELIDNKKQASLLAWSWDW